MSDFWHSLGLSREKEMLEQDAAIQLNLARSRQEVERQNNKLHPVTFQNKTPGVDTSTHREASCLPYCAVADSNHNWWGLPEGGAKPDRSGPLSSGIQIPLKQTNNYLSNRKRATSASLFKPFTCPSCLHRSNAALMQPFCLRLSFPCLFSGVSCYK